MIQRAQRSERKGIRINGSSWEMLREVQLALTLREIRRAKEVGGQTKRQRYSNVL